MSSLAQSLQPCRRSISHLFKPCYSGSTRYIRAFRKAFSILHHTLSSSSEDEVSRPVIILLISDEGQRSVFLQKVVISGVKKEFEAFRKKFTTTELNFVILSFGKDMAFFDQFADATVSKKLKLNCALITERNDRFHCFSFRLNPIGNYGNKRENGVVLLIEESALGASSLLLSPVPSFLTMHHHYLESSYFVG